MHNNIMAAGLRDHPLMLATGRYAQWQSRFLRYIDTIPNAVEAILNMSPENKAHYESEKEAIHLVLTGIGDEIYSTVDACKTAHEMWIAIERIQQGESLNIQDVKTNLFWEFGKFTSHDGESMESYYFRFYKIMNEMIRNNLTVATMQYQKEVNEIRAERIAKNANPLALVAATSPYPDPYYHTPRPHKPYAQTSKQSSSTRSNASTKFKGKEIAKPITPPSESASKEYNDPEQAQKVKEMQKTWHSLQNNQTSQFGNQRTVTVARARDTVGSQVVQQTGIQCFNCKEFGHFAKKCRKPKRLADMDEDIDEQELEAHYRYMAKIQEHSEQPGSISNTCVVEKVDSNIIPNSPDMCDNDIQTGQNVVECDDERVVLANLIANLKLDVDENKKIQKQLKKANTSLAHELKECKSILAETSRTLGESNSIRDSCLIALQNKQIELEMYKTLNDRTIDYDKLEHKYGYCKNLKKMVKTGQTRTRDGIECTKAGDLIARRVKSTL
ncbi:retrovirus-related pol polyprotein from transposon TNT 1-94 [Tanacetum coccineum]